MQPQPALETFSEAALQPKPLRSTLISRNVTIAGHRTSVRLEPEMWNGLIEICRRERDSIHAVCTAVAQNKPKNTSLTAAIRVFTMTYFRTAATEDGHSRVGHGQGLIGSTAVAAIRTALTSPSTAPPPRPVSSSPYMLGNGIGNGVATKSV